MIVKNRFFVLAAGATLVQQLLIAGSTWIIALAGQSLPANDYSAVRRYLLLFFVLALAAYLVSAVAEWLAVRASNAVWKNYVDHTIDQATGSLELGSESNRRAISLWLSSEAPSTISGGVAYYLGVLSMLTNILFTGLVFYLSLGFIMGSAVVAALIISLLFLFFLKARISTLTSTTQRAKMTAMSGLDALLITGFFGTKRMALKEAANFDSSVHGYFRSTQAYVRIEQFVACMPIVISVVVVSVTVSLLRDVSAMELGMLVAVLPRSLQLFGNVHSLSVYLSQFISVSQQLKNLNNFAGTLKRRCFAEQMKFEQMVVINATSRAKLSAQVLIELAATQKPVGRYLVQGPNGVGKSTLLSYMKSTNNDVIYLAPGVRFSAGSSGLSTGQTQMVELEALLLENCKIVLLDEWDANLDQANIDAMNVLLEQVSANVLVVEVRHRAS